MERVKPYVTEKQVRAAKEVNTLGFLLRHQPEPVSYTHLDVYKRQVMRRHHREPHREDNVPARAVILRAAAPLRRGKGGDAVSYTHLDVYKRQVERKRI